MFVYHNQFLFVSYFFNFFLFSLTFYDWNITLERFSFSRIIGDWNLNIVWARPCLKAPQFKQNESMWKIGCRFFSAYLLLFLFQPVLINPSLLNKLNSPFFSSYHATQNTRLKDCGLLFLLPTFLPTPHLLPIHNAEYTRWSQGRTSTTTTTTTTTKHYTIFFHLTNNNALA